MMNRSIVLGVAGLLVGVAVALAASTYLLDAGAQEAEAAPTSLVSVPGKLGPHITLADRVFNLVTEPGQGAVYLKLQTVIEFETRDQRWARVLSGCGPVLHGAHHGTHHEGARVSSGAPDALDAPGAGGGALLISMSPGAPVAPRAPGAVDADDPCEVELVALMAEFDRAIGSGRALIEDAVTTIVTAHTASEIATPQGKEALKAEIAVAVEKLIPEPPVTRVLFLNFITQ